MATKKCPYCAEEIQQEAIKCKHCGSWLAPRASDTWGSPDKPHTGSRRLVRSSRDRMFLGVCGGIGDYLGMDPTLVRVVFAVVTVFTAFVPGIVTYFLLGLILPSDVSVSV